MKGLNRVSTFEKKDLQKCKEMSTFAKEKSTKINGMTTFKNCIN